MLTSGDFASIGECMVELAPTADGLYRQGFAGDTLNTAWYVRALTGQGGRKVRYVSAVGMDALGIARHLGADDAGRIAVVRRAAQATNAAVRLEFDLKGAGRRTIMRTGRSGEAGGGIHGVVSDCWRPTIREDENAVPRKFVIEQRRFLPASPRKRGAAHA